MSEEPVGFRDRLTSGPPLLLDGAVGSELNRRGVDTSLPLWSARALLEAPEVLLAVHRDYVVAGADIITANTFRTNRRTLAKAGIEEQAAELTAVAVHLARAATGPSTATHYVAGSIAPLEDCYRTDLVPEDDVLEREHAESVEILRAAGADLLLIETMNTVREARAAARAAVASGLPVLAGLVCGRDGMMLSGEDPKDAARELKLAGVDAVLINCTPAPELPRRRQRRLGQHRRRRRKGVPALRGAMARRRGAHCRWLLRHDTFAYDCVEEAHRRPFGGTRTVAVMTRRLGRGWSSGASATGFPGSVAGVELETRRLFASNVAGAENLRRFRGVIEFEGDDEAPCVGGRTEDAPDQALGLLVILGVELDPASHTRQDRLIDVGAKTSGAHVDCLAHHLDSQDLDEVAVQGRLHLQRLRHFDALVLATLFGGCSCRDLL